MLRGDGTCNYCSEATTGGIVAVLTSAVVGFLAVKYFNA
eukprot:SAG11_NODE_458_length_9290_cov_2.641388_12_plen_39_part_00